MTEQQTTLPAAQLEKKRRKKGHGSARQRLAALTPGQVEQAEKLAAIGLAEDQIAWVLGISESTLQGKMRQGREQLESGKAKPDNLYAAIKRGRSQGDSILAKTAFEMATKDKNTSMLIFLAKSRLKWAEPAQDINVKQTVIFETQIGKDGVIRQQVMDADWDEAPQPKLPAAK